MHARVLVAGLVLLAACTPRKDGPEPSIDTVSPATFCAAQRDTTFTLAGSGFSPIVVNGLSDSPSVVMPQVLVGDLELPTSTVAFPPGDTSGNRLTAVVPAGALAPTGAGQPEQTYAVTVVNPNGHAFTREGAITVVPPPSVTGSEPAAGRQNAQVEIHLVGTGFRPNMAVRLEGPRTVPATSVTVLSPTNASARFDLTNVPVGTYSITVEIPEGCSFTLKDAFTVLEPPFAVLGIDPPFGCLCEATGVTIKSAGHFVSTPTVELVLAGTAAAEPVALERIAFIDESTLTAVVPAGLSLGTYHVRVYNPDGRDGALDNAFRVVSLPVPRIVAVAPGRGNTQQDTPVRIYGANFRDPVKVELLNEAGVSFPIPNAALVSDSEVQATIPTSILASGPYLVRVTNLDENTYFTFSNFLVTNPAGNLNVFETDSALVTPRQLLAGVSVDDEFGNHYLYAMGGASADGTALDSVELTRLSRFGDLGTWQLTGNDLNVPRVGAAAIAVPVYDPASPFIPRATHVYVLGGRDANGVPVNTIERASMLTSAQAPEITAIVTESNNGTLAAGTWYYKVSAVLSAMDPENPGGETLASEEVIVTLDASGSITLSWAPVTWNGLPAVAYRVYRTDAVNGRSQTEHFIKEVTTTTFTDTGEPAGTVSPLPEGALGKFVLLSTPTLTTGRWGHQAVITRDASGNRYVTVLGGQGSGGAVLASVEVAPIDANGAVGTFVASTAMGTARAFFSAVVETRDNVVGYTSDASRVIVMGGRSGTGALLNSIEYADVGATGALGTWTSYARTLQKSSAGIMSLILNNKLFVLGGATAVNGTQFSSITNAGSDSEFDASGNLTGSVNSTARSLLAPRAFGVAIHGSGFTYFIGGTSNGTDAVAITERTF